jgi:hypothetical protein
MRAIFILSFLLSLDPLVLAQISPPHGREEASNAWNVEQLLQSIAKNRQTEVRFKETSFSHLLTKPLKSQGILRFTPPATLEKQVTGPQDERYLVEGDKILVESKARRMNKTLSLQDYPILQAFVEAFRSTLGNDVHTLRRFYRVTLDGSPSQWVMTLQPLNQAMREVVELIRFSGEGEQVERIAILAPDGDESVMVITTGIP